jgi:hypothetical protein
VEAKKTKKAIIACKTLEDEVVQVIEKTGTDFPVYWIESGLHNYPERLKEKLQQEINGLTEYNYIILFFGLCGNALLGLSSTHSTLIVPQVDDCISLFLGGNAVRREIEESFRAYYLTKGWLRYENNIWKEYQRSLEKYGPERTRSIFTIMFKHYSHLLVIDTGAYDAKEFIKEAEDISTELGLQLAVVPADLSIMVAALQNRWDQGFALIKPQEAVSMQSMCNCINYLTDEKGSTSPC